MQFIFEIGVKQWLFVFYLGRQPSPEGCLKVVAVCKKCRGQSAQSHNTRYQKAKHGANMTKKTILKSVFITFSHAERREVSK